MRQVLAGLSIVFALCCLVAAEISGLRLISSIGGLGVVFYALISFSSASFSARAFVVTAAALSCLALIIGRDAEILLAPLASANFVGAFFAALATLRLAASTSPAIGRCGRYFATQPPGRRYTALTIGGHLFSIMLNYGALSLLGTMAEQSVRHETNPERRRIRLRRMLLAIQRGVISMLGWSPIGFPMAMTTTLIPGASWAGAVLPGAGIAILMLTLGYALDTIFKPRLNFPPVATVVEGTWRDMKPLLLLLVVLLSLILVLEEATGLRAAVAAIIVVPGAAAVWLAIQASERPIATMARRLWYYIVEDIPDYHSEISLLAMAGYIGTLGAALLLPFTQGGLNLGVLPPLGVILLLVWIVPIGGQVGVNPILAIALIAPLLPDPASLGLPPNLVALSLVSGWVLCGASSPFTANTMLLGRIGGVSARHVGVVWNGPYTVLGAIILSAWLALVAQFYAG